MPEFEEAAESAQDLIKEELLLHEGKEKSGWIRWVGLSTMIMALLVAIGALLVSYSFEELMLERTEEIIEISYLEADRLDIELLKTKHAILLSLGEAIDKLETEKVLVYQDEIKELEVDIKSEKLKANKTLYEHHLFAIGVTLFSIALTLSGMSMILKSKKIWVVGIGISVVGIIFIGIGIYQMIS